MTARFPTYAAYLNAAVAAVDKLVWQRFYQCGQDTQTELGNLLSTAYAGTVPVIPNQLPVITNADWSFVTGGNQNSPTPPALLPACNGALTHNFNGATGQLQTGAAIQVPLVAGFDGNSDILWRDTSGNVGLWLMNGASIQSTAVVASVPTTWSIVGQRDFNGDGNADILWRDDAGNVALWQSNANSDTFAYRDVNSAGLKWTIQGTADFNGDGKADILWRDNAGEVAFWESNPNSDALSFQDVNSAGLDWHILL